MSASQKDTDDEADQDFDDFNIQSPPSYDVAEKIREANRLLEEDKTPVEKIKSPKVKFKEQIVEFEVEISDFSSDEAASTDEWLTPQLKINEEEKCEDKTLLGSDSEDDDTSLMPLEEDVKLGFPHQASYQCEDEPPSSPEEERELKETLEDERLLAVGEEEKMEHNPLAVLVANGSDRLANSPSEPSDELLVSVAETFAPSSPISDDIPDTCDGLSLSTDNISSKLGPESPITELDISEEFQLSLDLNKDQIIEVTKTSIKISIQTPEINVEINDDLSSKHAKRKDSLKLQHYRKSIEGPISSEWNQFQTVTDGITPRELASRCPTPEKLLEKKDAAVNSQERPSSSRGIQGSRSVNPVRARPWTAPNSSSRRGPGGSKWSCAQLPNYNGMRSEYGLSQEQLEERKRLRQQLTEERRERVHRKHEEESQRRDENERVFRAWLARKQSENALESRGGHTEEHRLSARLRREQAEESFKQWLQRKKQEKRARQRLTLERHLSNQQDLTYRPDESQAAFKQWMKSKQKPGTKRLNKRLLLNNNPATLEKILNEMDPHTQSTFRIYLGVSKIEMSQKRRN